MSIFHFQNLRLLRASITKEMLFIIVVLQLYKQMLQIERGQFQFYRFSQSNFPSRFP